MYFCSLQTISFLSSSLQLYINDNRIKNKYGYISAGKKFENLYSMAVWKCHPYYGFAEFSYMNFGRIDGIFHNMDIIIQS